MTARVRAVAIALLGLSLLVGGCRSDTVWSPNSQKLALDPKGLLFTFDLATRKFAQHTKGPTLALNPTWSPDGKRISYYSVKMQKNEGVGPSQKIAAMELMVFDPATAKHSVLVANVPQPTDAEVTEGVINLSGDIDLARELLVSTWSPDGKKIAYVAYEKVDPVLWVANSDGSNPQRLLPGKSAARPSWSPDSSLLAFHVENPRPPKPADAPEPPPLKDGEVRLQPDTRPVFSLEVAAPDGSGHRVLWPASRPEPLSNIGPDPEWAADGKSVRVVVDVPDENPMPAAQGGPPGQCALWTVPLEGEPKLLAPIPGPSVFASVVGGKVGFFFKPKKEEATPRLGLLIPPYETPKQTHQLTVQQIGGKDVSVDGIPVPALSPDGKWVALSVVPDKGAGYLNLFPTAGGQPQRYQIPLPVTGKKPAAPAKKPVPAGKKAVKKPIKRTR